MKRYSTGPESFTGKEEVWVSRAQSARNVARRSRTEKSVWQRLSRRESAAQSLLGLVSPSKWKLWKPVGSVDCAATTPRYPSTFSTKRQPSSTRFMPCYRSRWVAFICNLPLSPPLAHPTARLGDLLWPLFYPISTSVDPACDDKSLCFDASLSLSFQFFHWWPSKLYFFLWKFLFDSNQEKTNQIELH